MWEEMKKIEENYKKGIRFLYFRLGRMMVVFMFFGLIMRMGRDILWFLKVERLEKGIGRKIK
ncbi:DUF334 domain-containing protein [Staphylococcus hominis]|uniref:DUF334 domain-containing protein n=1 Tax=Staphylococcus hominis TaxID=1290 RepID=UPI0028D769E6|nr:DUF334 domain-containing protein [Staphylococcus hominis]